MAPCRAPAQGSHAAAIDELLEAVEFGDLLGLDGWFFPEKRGLPEHSLDSSPHLVIAALSRRTKRIRLGTMVDLLPFAHPLRLAEEIRFLDTLTHGRLEVGVGPGGPREHLRWGTAPEDGPEMFEVAVTLLRGILKGDPADFDTRWWRGRPAQLTPEPVQQPHPPLWLATKSGRTVESAAQWGMNCQSGPAPLDVLAERIVRYRTCWLAQWPTTPGGRFSVLVDVVVNEDGDAARQAGAEFHRRRLDRRRRSVPAEAAGVQRVSDGPSPSGLFEELPYAELVQQGLAICGNVAECSDQLTRLTDLGVDAVTAWMPFGEVDTDFARRSLELFCKEVIPLVESRSAADRFGQGRYAAHQQVWSGRANAVLADLDDAPRES